MNGEDLALIEPTEDLRSEYAAYCSEFAHEGKVPDVGSGLPTCADFAAGVRACRDHARGVNLPPGWVPAHTFWLIRVDDERDGRTIIGEMNLRHALTPALELQGGHVGYAVRPAERRRGYATFMLAHAITVARQLGLRRLLITCDQRNVASARVIEKNGGILRDEIPSANPLRRRTRRYWIET